MVSGRWCRDGSRTDAGGEGETTSTSSRQGRGTNRGGGAVLLHADLAGVGLDGGEARGLGADAGGDANLRGDGAREGGQSAVVARVITWRLDGLAKRSSRRVRGCRGARTHLVHAGAAGEGGGLAGLHGDGGGEGSDGGHCCGRDARGGMRARRDAPYTSAQDRAHRTAGSLSGRRAHQRHAARRPSKPDDRSKRTASLSKTNLFIDRPVKQRTETILFAKIHTL